MKKFLLGLAGGVLVFGILGCLGYYGLAVYYKDGFALNTWINGVYCTGKTVSEVNEELLDRITLPEYITVTGYDTSGGECVDASWRISLKDINLKADYTESLNHFLEWQNPWNWVDNFISHTEHTVQPVLSCEKSGLEEQWREIVRAAYSDRDYRIVYQEKNGYSLHDSLHNCLDEKKAYQMLLDAIIARRTSVDLVEGGCYYDVAPTQEQRELASLWEQIELFQESGPVYDLGEGIVKVTEAAMTDMLEKEKSAPYLPVLDEERCLQIADGAVDSFVQQMADMCDTYEKTWEFQSTRGDIVNVKGVTYGTTINRKKESEWLEDYLTKLCTGEPVSNGESEPHIPVYSRDAMSRSFTTLGDTYIEVDMGEQKLYYYEQGELKLETDVVTGNVGRGMRTPEGVNYVYAKQKNRVLRGADYATPVKFWMPVKGAIGIHDANWRGKFGGEIYKTNGSHGCINVPSKVMPELYSMVEIGTPVIMFYGEKTG